MPMATAWDEFLAMAHEGQALLDDQPSHTRH